MPKGKILIIGGGATGLCSAYYLQKEGWSIDIVDAGDFTDNCSFGNAGMIVPSHFIPLAAPGVVSQGLRWLFNKKSPFSIHPAFDLDLLKWGVQFIKHANKAHVHTSAGALRDLNVFSREQYLELYKENDFDFPLSTKGVLMLYRTEKKEAEEKENARIAQVLDLNCEVLNKDEVQDIEPGLTREVLGGVLYKSDAYINPVKFMQNLREDLESKGVNFYKNQAIWQIECQGNHVQNVQSKEETFTADRYILSPGANLGNIARLAGLSIPIQPGKGYSFMTKNFKKSPNYPALLKDDEISITPMNGEVRIGGTMELGKTNHKVNPHKIAGIKQAVPKYYTDVDLATIPPKAVWQGARPCSPDGLPYLGKSTTLRNLIIAGGSCMMGMSFAPGLGRIVSELAEAKEPSVNIEQFDPQRFG